MKALLTAVLVLGLVLVTWLVASSRERAPAPGQRAERAAPDPVVQARLERLDAAAEKLGHRVGYLEEELAAVKAAFRESLARGAAGQGEAFSLRSYLDEYVRSFRDGGPGSEYFRLAVDAYAGELLHDIMAVVRDPDAPVALRQRLVQMLASPRFRGDSRVAGALLALVDAGVPEALALAALQGMAAVGDASAAEALEGAVFSLRSPALVQAALAAIRQLGGDRSNAIARRLFHAAPDDPGRIAVLQLALPGDPANAVDLIRDAWAHAVPVRMAAAGKLGQLKEDPFRRLVDELLDVERDEGVRKALEQAKAQQSSVPSWHALKATGPADAVPANQDHPNAWATRQGNMGIQWLELGYERPMRAHAVRIFEVNSPGAVVRVETVDEAGTRRTVWQGDDPTETAGVFEVTFAATGYRVARVRVVLDTDRRPGWNEIDAVELVGPDGRAWAATAAASSIYGQP